MYVKYCGPGSWVNVHPYGQHNKDQIKPYPDKFAEELLATSERNQWEQVAEPPERAEEKMSEGESEFASAGADEQMEAVPVLQELTVAELREMARERGIEIARKVRKIELINLLEG